MLRVLPPTNQNCLAASQVVNRFEQGWQNAQHRYSTRFVTMLQNMLHVFVARFIKALVIFTVIYPGCRSGAWRWRARPGTSGARTSERWKSAGGGRRNAAGNTRKRTTAGTGKLTERFRTFEINSKLLSCCCGATEGSEQQHNQDLKEIYKGRRILKFITFYHNALHLTTLFTTMHCT